MKINFSKINFKNILCIDYIISKNSKNGINNKMGL